MTQRDWLVEVMDKNGGFPLNRLAYHALAQAIRMEG